MGYLSFIYIYNKFKLHIPAETWLTSRKMRRKLKADGALKANLPRLMGGMSGGLRIPTFRKFRNKMLMDKNLAIATVKTSLL